MKRRRRGGEEEGKRREGHWPTGVMSQKKSAGPPGPPSTLRKLRPTITGRQEGSYLELLQPRRWIWFGLVSSGWLGLVSLGWLGLVSSGC